MVCFHRNVWCIADLSSVSSSSEQTLDQQRLIWCASRRKIWCKADVLRVNPSTE